MRSLFGDESEKQRSRRPTHQRVELTTPEAATSTKNRKEHRNKANPNEWEKALRSRESSERGNPNDWPKEPRRENDATKLEESTLDERKGGA